MRKAILAVWIMKPGETKAERHAFPFHFKNLVSIFENEGVNDFVTACGQAAQLVLTTESRLADATIFTILNENATHLRKCIGAMSNPMDCIEVCIGRYKEVKGAPHKESNSRITGLPPHFAFASL